MRRKQLAKRVAIAVLSAATVMTAAPAGAFAAPVEVSIDASDAAVVTSPEVSVNDTTSDSYKIKDDLETSAQHTGLALVDNTKKGTSRNAADWKLTGKSAASADPSTSDFYTYKVKSISLSAPKVNEGKTDVEEPKITVVADVTKGSGATSEGKGTVTVTYNAADVNDFKLTAEEKIATLKAFVEAKLPDIEFADSDNDTSAYNKINAVVKIGATDEPAILKRLIDPYVKDTREAGDSSDATYEVTVGAATKATSSTDGSLQMTITYHASNWVDNNGAAKEDKKTDTSSVTGKIPKTKAQNDGAYAQRIQNAIAAATWTSDDFTPNADGTAATLTESTTAGTAKLVNVIKAADDNTLAKFDETTGVLVNVSPATFTYNNADVTSSTGVTVSRYTAPEHGKDGFAHLHFFTARKDGGTTYKVDSFDVDVTIKEGDTAVKNELKDAFTKALTVDLKTSDLQSGSKAASQDDVVNGIKKVIDARLAKSVNGKTYASDIKDYTIDVTKYNKSTVDKYGNIQFYITVDTGRTSAADPTKTDVWYFNGTNAGTVDGQKTDNSYSTTPVNTATYSQTTADGAKNVGAQFNVINLAKLGKSAATGISLPSTISYNVKAAGKTTSANATTDTTTGIALKDYVKVTPADANNWTIRWTNSNTTDYALVGKNSAGTVIEKTLTTAKAGDLPTLKLINDAASTVITAELLDDDGNVVATAKTTVTAANGFDDVQNASYFAYNPINALSSTVKLEKDSTATLKKYKTNGSRYENLDVAAGTKLSASPVIAGIGNNKFDPYANVTRGQFITFLWRNAVNEYSFADATTQAYTKDPASYTGKTDFADVDAKAYYAKAVEWAAKNGIAFGADATHFNPNKTITRAEAVSFIYRLKAQGAVYNNYQQFDDVSSSAYYANAVGYARSAGITAGKSGTKFAPNDTVTRGEAAAFIYRMAAGEDGFYYDAVDVTPAP